MYIWKRLFLAVVYCAFPFLLGAQCSVGTGPELVVNGNFDAGIFGFSSDMVQGAVNSGANRWELGTNANLLHPSFTGAGIPTPMMFVANGPTAVMRAWFQNVPVSAGTNYVFAAKVCNVVNPASNLTDPTLRLSINGMPVSASVSPPEVPDVWVPLCAVWNSGASTNALLAIETLNTASGGNDFGLDSISLKLEVVFPVPDEPVSETADVEAGSWVYPNPVRVGEWMTLQGIVGAVNWTDAAGRSFVGALDVNGMWVPNLAAGLYYVRGRSGTGKLLVAKVKVEK
jgi:hypothetical protein